MTSEKTNQPRSRTIYNAEGGIHLYSSEASALTPAALYQVKDDPVLRQLLCDCNIYLIVARRRILMEAQELAVKKGKVHGLFIVQRTTGVVYVPFSWQLPEGWEEVADDAIEVIQAGTHLRLCRDTRQFLVPAHVIVAHALSGLEDSDKDLDVLYVGQALGRSQQRSAIDRLLGHTTLQRILAEMTTFYPESEVLLLLYRFEHGRTLVSTGGDLTAVPLASLEEERAHLDRMQATSLSRHEQIALAEAALIRYFQPWFNVQIKNNDFTRKKKIKVLDGLLKKDITGVIVEICTSNIASRLTSAQAPPLQLTDFFEPDILNGSALDNDDDKRKWHQQLQAMAHTHIASFALTTPEERDTFMHGVRWHGEEQRMGFMGRP